MILHIAGFVKLYLMHVRKLNVCKSYIASICGKIIGIISVIYEKIAALKGYQVAALTLSGPPR